MKIKRLKWFSRCLHFTKFRNVQVSLTIETCNFSQHVGSSGDLQLVSLVWQLSDVHNSTIYHKFGRLRRAVFP